MNRLLVLCKEHHQHQSQWQQRQPQQNGLPHRNRVIIINISTFFLYFVICFFIILLCIYMFITYVITVYFISLKLERNRKSIISFLFFYTHRILHRTTPTPIRSNDFDEQCTTGKLAYQFFHVIIRSKFKWNNPTFQMLLPPKYKKKYENSMLCNNCFIFILYFSLILTEILLFYYNSMQYLPFVFFVFHSILQFLLADLFVRWSRMQWIMFLYRFTCIKLSYIMCSAWTMPNRISIL